MKLEPNWTVSDRGPWQLIYNDISIISLSKATGMTSTQGSLFVGSKEECEAEIARLGLPWAADLWNGEIFSGDEVADNTSI